MNYCARNSTGNGMVDRLTSAKSPVAMRRWGNTVIVMLAAMAALTASNADAPARQARRAQPAETTAPREAGEPIMAIVSIKSQQVTFYDAEAGSCVRRYRPASRNARRQPASSPSSRRTRTTTRPCMTMPGCRTCCASPGTASRCMAGRCPAMRPHTAACECLMALRRSCSTRRGSGCA